MAFAPPALLWLLSFHQIFLPAAHIQPGIYSLSSPKYVKNKENSPFLCLETKIYILRTPNLKPWFVVKYTKRTGFITTMYGKEHHWNAFPPCKKYTLKCLCPSWFMDIYMPNFAGQAETRREKSVPSIPCSILVCNNYAYHLFLLFQSKLLLTCIFFISFCPQL